MGLFRGIGRLVKPLLDVKTWSDSSRVIEHGKNVFSDAKKLFIPMTPTNTETFEEAAARLNIKESDLERLKYKFFFTSLIFLLLGCAAIFYFLYIFAEGTWHTWPVAIVVVLLAFTQFFRYHFWYYQIRSRRLGCTMREWFRHGLLKLK